MSYRKCLTIVYGLFLAVSSTSANSALILGEAWKSKNVTGYAGKKTKRLNFGEVELTTTRNDYPDNENFTSTTISGQGTISNITYAGVRRLSWFEDKNRPCAIEVKPKLLNDMLINNDPDNNTAQSISKVVVDFCKGKPGNEKKILLPKKHVARGISVCTTDKKDTKDNRVKGIRLYAAKINNDGNVINTTIVEGNEHKNCKDNWHKPVYCPAGKIISGFEIHKKGKSKKMYMTGFGIKCREVKQSDSAFQ